MHRRCPRCRQNVPLGGSCPCRAAVPPFWSMGSLPEPGRFWLLPLLAVPLAWALGEWALDSDVSTNDLTLLVLMLPVVTQLLPSTRARGGGCGIGCVMSLAMLITLAQLGHAPSWQPAGKPVLRLDPAQPCTVDGVGLGDRPPFPSPLRVVSRGGHAAAIEGHSLRQRGKLLLQVGDPYRKIACVLPAGVRVLQTPQGTLSVETSGGFVSRITLKEGAGAP